MFEGKATGNEVNKALMGPVFSPQARVKEEKADGSPVFYRITIKEWREGRSTGEHSQNNHIHGHVRDIVCSGLSNGSVSATKRILASMAADAGRYPVVMVLGQLVPKDDTDLDTAEAAEFIEFLHQFAAEWDVTLTEKEWS